MNCEASKWGDARIRRAVEEGCVGIAAAYDAIDTEDVYVSERLDRLVYRLIRHRENGGKCTKGMRIVGRVAVGAVLVSLLILMLVISIAAARGELISSLVEWYDDHIAIHFDKIEELPGDGMLPTAPTYLKDMYEPCIIGYTRKCERLDDMHYETFVLGYYDDVQVQVCKYQQSVWRLSLTPQDEDLYNITEVCVGEFRGKLYDEKNGEDLILLWDDGCYRYKLQSDVFVAEDLIGWAQNLTVAYDVMPSPVIDIRRPVIDSTVITYQVIKQEPDYISTDYYRNGAYVCRFIQTTAHKNDGGVLSGGLGDPQRVADVVIGRHVGLAYIYSGMIQVIWEDDDYQYRMQSPCMTLKEMLRWCETTKSVGERFEGIRQILSPRGLSSDIEERIFEKSRRRVEIDYYRDGEKICTYTQMILSVGVPSNGKGYVERAVTIHHGHGVFRRYDSGKLVMVWNDNNYRYRLESEHLSEQELMDWALSIAPPFTLEELRKPSVGGNIKENLNELNEASAQYSYVKDGQTIAVFRQMVMNTRTNDYEGGCIPVDIPIGEYLGVALIYENGKKVLIWTDKTYSYELESCVLTMDELVKMGISVKAVDVDQGEQHPEDIPLPDSLEQTFLPDYGGIGCTIQEVERTDVSVKTEFYMNNRWVGTLTQSILRIDMMEYTSGRAYAKRGEVNGRFCYTIYTWEGDKLIRVWTDGQYRYRLEMNQKYQFLLHIFANIPQT